MKGRLVIAFSYGIRSDEEADCCARVFLRNFTHQSPSSVSREVEQIEPLFLEGSQHLNELSVAFIMIISYQNAR